MLQWAGCAVGRLCSGQAEGLMRTARAANPDDI